MKKQETLDSLSEITVIFGDDAAHILLPIKGKVPNLGKWS